MSDRDLLAQRFETHREHLRAVALRMLGSSHEADDAVQEAWLRLSRADADAVDNLGGWLTTVVARVCLDALRLRATKREVPPERTSGARLPAKLHGRGAVGGGPSRTSSGRRRTHRRSRDRTRR
ncbi:MAG TPA: sigma factor [Acidimicrobiales bacterium]|nr:sigma factor [Acidimicrobiales bacterium]